MKTLRYLLPLSLSLSAFTAQAIAHEDDDPLLARVILNQLETRDADGSNPSVLEGEAWIGHDLHKLWIKVDAQRVDGKTEELETQALFSRAIAPFWDIQAGLRRDTKPGPGRTWGVLGVQGLAPYEFDMSAALFVGDQGRTAARIRAEYELLFTQRLILTPEIEVNAYGQNDPETGTGSGLSDITAGLRLRYEIRREFAPYVGVNWEHKFGNTADFARASGEATRDTQLVLGLRAWF